MATVQSAVGEPAALRARTLCEAFQLTASERPDQVAVRAPGGDGALTFAQLAARVARIAAGLAELGVRRGDTVGLMLLNRPEFAAADLAVMHLGAIPFSIYNTLPQEQIGELFANAGNRVVITERMLLPAIHKAAPVGVEHVVLIDGDEPGTLSLAALEARGDPRFDLDAAWRTVEPDDLVTLIYTSGTTGAPKGVEVTHAGIQAVNRGVMSLAPITPGGRSTSFLPSAHIADRQILHYMALCCLGFTLTYVPDPRRIAAALPEVRPTVWGAVPRVWEKLRAGLEAQGLQEPDALDDERKAAVRAQLGFADCELFIVGAAPLAVEELRYFDALGIRILEVWGMSETSCVATMNPRVAPRFGSCGVAIPGVELKLAEDDDELLVRGPTLMRGYRREPERTAEALGADGWLRTGDVAEFDADGYVWIVDRKKELIINAAGKNMSPSNIEARLKAAHPLIGQAVAIGDRRPYNVALIVLDPDVATAYARELGAEGARLPDLAAHPRVNAAVAAAVAEANEHVARVEQIKRFTVVPIDWQPGGDELTPTMKLKRRPIAEKYVAEIEAMYAR